MAVPDIETDIKNTLDARERIHAVHATLVQHRRNALNVFLQTFAGDIAAAGSNLGQTFVDAQFDKFTAWKNADDEIASRIAAFTSIAVGIDNRIHEFTRDTTLKA